MNTATSVLPSSYVICAYVRLSIEDEDVGGLKVESGSISAQRKLIHRYIDNHPEFAKCQVIERCDDGYSGTHFDTRPQFTDMIEQCKKGRINCIIVKDCSRFGRDYVELGDYLEQFFPFMGIRFISINDGYDSESCEGGLDIAFKNLIYDFYSRELSVKVKQAKVRLAEQGKYSAGQTLYGYRKKKGDKHSLELDPKSAPIVREIFDMRLSGMRLVDIARNLNDRGIPCPTALCWKEGRVATKHDKGRKLYWTGGVVGQLLGNEMYTGCVINFRTGAEERGGKQVQKPEEEWVKVEGMHEAIVSKEEYQKVAEMVKEIKKPEPVRHPMHYYCGVCGRKLLRLNPITIHCGMEYALSEPSECDGVRIKWKEADAAVLDELKEKLLRILRAEELRLEKAKKEIPLKEEIESVENAIVAANDAKNQLIRKMAERSISRDVFLDKKKKQDEQITELEQRLSDLKTKELMQRDKGIDTDEIRSFLDVSEMTEKEWDRFIDKVVLYPNHKMVIQWKFEEEL